MKPDFGLGMVPKAGRRQNINKAMIDDQRYFLSLQGRPGRSLPLRFDAQQVAWTLNCEVHDIPGLIRDKLLKPLGKPKQNARKFFDPEEVFELAKRLDALTASIYRRWREQNTDRIARSSDEQQSLAA